VKKRGFIRRGTGRSVITSATIAAKISNPSRQTQAKTRRFEKNFLSSPFLAQKGIVLDKKNTIFFIFILTFTDKLV